MFQTPRKSRIFGRLSLVYMKVQGTKNQGSDAKTPKMFSQCAFDCPPRTHIASQHFQNPITDPPFWYFLGLDENKNNQQIFTRTLTNKTTSRFAVLINHFFWTNQSPQEFVGPIHFFHFRFSAALLEEKIFLTLACLWHLDSRQALLSSCLCLRFCLCPVCCFCCLCLCRCICICLCPVCFVCLGLCIYHLCICLCFCLCGWCCLCLSICLCPSISNSFCSCMYFSLSGLYFSPFWWVFQKDGLYTRSPFTSVCVLGPCVLGPWLALRTVLFSFGGL